MTTEKAIVFMLSTLLVTSVTAYRVVHEHLTVEHPSLEAAAASARYLQDEALPPDVYMAPSAVQPDQLGEEAPSTTMVQPGGQDDKGPWIEQISSRPRAYLHHGFLTNEEADHLIQLATPHLAKSKVVLGESGVVTDSTFRTSSGAWVSRGQDLVVSRIEQRIADWTGKPVENAEPMHVLHYGVNAEYQEHYDAYFDEVNLANGGQRIATVIMYLSTVEEGGETVFPMSANEASPGEKQKLSECALQGAAARAVKGDALLFYNVLPSGNGQEIDYFSTHAGCPVLKGEKWAATKWIRMHEWIDAPLSQVEGIKRERQAAQKRTAVNAQEL